MAAAWPYCDAVVSAHRLTELAELMAALADPARSRRTVPLPPSWSACVTRFRVQLPGRIAQSA